VIKDGRLTLGDGGKIKLDIYPFPVGMVELMDKKVFVCTDQAKMTKGKNVVFSNELHNQMIKAHNPEIGTWKENMLQKLAKRVKPTSAMLIKKYQWQLKEDWKYWLPEESNRIDSSKPETSQITKDHGI
jgi:hypothetical protein